MRRNFSDIRNIHGRATTNTTSTTPSARNTSGRHLRVSASTGDPSQSISLNECGIKIRQNDRP